MGLINNITNRVLGRVIDSRVNAKLGEIIKASQGDPSGMLVGYNQYNSNEVQSPKVHPDMLWMAYISNQWVAACVDTIVSNVCGGGWELIENPETSTHNVANKNKLMEYFINPNEDEMMITQLRNYTGDLKIFGNSYAEKSRFSQLSNRRLYTYNMDARSMRVQADKHGIVEQYKQIVGKDVVNFDPKDIIHIKQDNIGNDIYGMSPIEKLIKVITADGMALNWNINYFKNSGRVNDIINLGANKNQDSAKAFLDYYEAAYVGVQNASRPLVVYGGMTVDRDARNMREMEFTKLLEMMREAIMGVYGVPPSHISVVGYAKSGNNPEQDLKFTNDVVQPVRTVISHSLNKKVVQDEYQIDDYMFAFKDAGNMRVQQAKAEYVRGLVVDGVITPNEARAKIGEEEHPDGNALRAKANVAGVKDADVALIREALMELVDTDGRIKIPVGTDLKKKLNEGSDGSNIKELEFSNAEEYWQRYIALTEIQEKKFAAVLKKLYQEQQNFINDGLKQAAKKDIRATVDVEAILFEPNQERDKWIERLTPVYSNTIEAHGSQFYEDLLLQGQFDKANPIVAQELASRVYRFSDEQVKSATEMIREQLAEGSLSGESIYQLMTRIGKEYDALKGYKAERVARTETIHAANFGTVQGYKQSGIVKGKRWFTANDERTCPFCFSMNDKVVELDTSYWELGDTISVVNDAGKTQTFNFGYEAIDHPPLHPMCRCYLVPDFNEAVISGQPTEQVFKEPTTVQEAAQWIQQRLGLKSSNYGSISLDTAKKANKVLEECWSKFKSNLDIIEPSKARAYGDVASAHRLRFSSKWYNKVKQASTEWAKQVEVENNMHWLSVAVTPDTHIVHTAYHEFAHTLTNYWGYFPPARANEQAFWDGLKQIRSAYKAEHRAIGRKAMLDSGNYISDYAMSPKNMYDEFLAESFSMCMMDKKPSIYAQQVMDLVNIYFKK